jgi:hypothetical protein
MITDVRCELGLPETPTEKQLKYRVTSVYNSRCKLHFISDTAGHINNHPLHLSNCSLALESVCTSKMFSTDAHDVRTTFHAGTMILKELDVLEVHLTSPEI